MAALAGSALLGIVAGVIWAAVAPRAVLQEVARGEADLVNAESSAFIVADAWFCLIVVGRGTYHRHPRLPLPGAPDRLDGGGRTRPRRGRGRPARALDRREHRAGTYNHLLATSQNDTLFHASLALGAKSALAFWPLLTSAVILLAESGARRPAAATGTDKSDASGMWTSGPAGERSP